MGIQLQTRGGPTNFTIAKIRILENRGGGGRSLRDTHSPGWSSFLRETPQWGTEPFMSQCQNLSNFERSKRKKTN